jgi:hypothetical protein
MPQPSPPYNSANPSQDEVIQALSAWIDAGCPNGAAAQASGGDDGPPTERRSDDESGGSRY